MPTKFDAEDKMLQDILTGAERYRIPRYQRPYSWTRDQVSDLWNDLMHEESYFLGSFVFNYENFNKDKVVEVIDGQQRLITLTLLLAVLRDFYNKLDSQEKAYLTQTTAIQHTDLISGVAIYRLKCGDTLEHFFSHNIQSKDADIISSNPKKKEERAIKDNYVFLRDRIQEEIDNLSDKSKKEQFLDELKKKIFDLRVIWIRIESDEDAYSIFETVNARGADLTAADLLKNHLFKKIPKQEGAVDIAKDTWSDVEENIENAKGSLNVSKFIRYYWLSKYSFTSEKRLYKEVKNTITKPTDFLNDLLKASEYYFKIANESSNESVWRSEFENPKTALRINEALVGLRIMGITQCCSLFFCLLMNKEKIGYDFSDIFKVIEKYHFAYSAVCKLSGNVVEKVYFKTSQAIQEALKISHSEKRVKAIQSALSNFKNQLEYPTKDFFLEKFMDIEYKNYPLVIYILSNIEKAKAETEETNINYTKVNIEHILPQDPGE